MLCGIVVAAAVIVFVCGDYSLLTAYNYTDLRSL